jgi:SAM-dependent methyltransferase
VSRIDLVNRPNRRDTWYRARGLDLLDARFAEPSVLTILDTQLAAARPMRILEIGCGEAHALMALAWRYRDRPVSLAGLNDRPTDTMSCPDHLREACVDFDICSRQEASSLALPTLVFADAGERLPFADGSFDLVVSGTTFPCIVDKARALTEVWRVLDQDGTALIHLDSFDRKLPDFLNTAGDSRLFMPRFVIYDPQRNRLPTAAYLTRRASAGFDIRVESSPGRPTHTVVRFSRRTRERLDFGLTLDDVSTLPRMEDLFSVKNAAMSGLLWGARSVYFAQGAG